MEWLLPDDIFVLLARDWLAGIKLTRACRRLLIILAPSLRCLIQSLMIHKTLNKQGLNGEYIDHEIRYPNGKLYKLTSTFYLKPNITFLDYTQWFHYVNSQCIIEQLEYKPLYKDRSMVWKINAIRILTYLNYRFMNESHKIISLNDAKALLANYGIVSKLIHTFNNE